MEILVCDRCGFELTERETILMALDGTDAWHNACHGRGQEPRGLFPCKYFINCQGEMQLVEAKKKKQ